MRKRDHDRAQEAEYFRQNFLQASDPPTMDATQLGVAAAAAAPQTVSFSSTDAVQPGVAAVAAAPQSDSSTSMRTYAVYQRGDDEVAEPPRLVRASFERFSTAVVAEPPRRQHMQTEQRGRSSTRSTGDQTQVGRMDASRVTQGSDISLVACDVCGHGVRPWNHNKCELCGSTVCLHCRSSVVWTPSQSRHVIHCKVCADVVQHGAVISEVGMPTGFHRRTYAIPCSQCREPVPQLLAYQCLKCRRPVCQSRDCQREARTDRSGVGMTKICKDCW